MLKTSDLNHFEETARFDPVRLLKAMFDQFQSAAWRKASVHLSVDKTKVIYILYKYTYIYIYIFSMCIGIDFLKYIVYYEY